MRKQLSIWDILRAHTLLRILQSNAIHDGPRTNSESMNYAARDSVNNAYYNGYIKNGFVFLRDGTVAKGTLQKHYSALKETAEDIFGALLIVESWDIHRCGGVVVNDAVTQSDECEGELSCPAVLCPVLCKDILSHLPEDSITVGLVKIPSEEVSNTTTVCDNDRNAILNHDNDVLVSDSSRDVDNTILSTSGGLAVCEERLNGAFMKYVNAIVTKDDHKYANDILSNLIDFPSLLNSIVMCSIATWRHAMRIGERLNRDLNYDMRTVVDTQGIINLGNSNSNSSSGSSGDNLMMMSFPTQLNSESGTTVSAAETMRMIIESQKVAASLGNKTTQDKEENSLEMKQTIDNITRISVKFNKCDSDFVFTNKTADIIMSQIVKVTSQHETYTISVSLPSSMWSHSGEEIRTVTFVNDLVCHVIFETLLVLGKLLLLASMPVLLKLRNESNVEKTTNSESSINNNNSNNCIPDLYSIPTGSHMSPISINPFSLLAATVSHQRGIMSYPNRGQSPFGVVPPLQCSLFVLELLLVWGTLRCTHLNDSSDTALININDNNNNNDYHLHRFLSNGRLYVEYPHLANPPLDSELAGGYMAMLRKEVLGQTV